MICVVDKMGRICGTHGTNEKRAKSLGDKHKRKRKLGQCEDIITVYTREKAVSCVDWIFCSGEDPVAGFVKTLMNTNMHEMRRISGLGE